MFDDSVGSERLGINHSEMEKKLYMVKILTYMVLHTGRLNNCFQNILNVQQMCAKTNDGQVLAEMGRFMECLCYCWKHEHCTEVVQ